MNLAKLVRWAKRVLWHLTSGKKAVITEDLKKQFQWIQAYRGSIEGWGQWLAVIEQTLDLVRREGLSSSTHCSLEERLKEFRLGDPLSTGLLKFVEEQSQQLQPNERLPMTTEVLESLFSKLKNVEKTQEKSGFTSLVLTLGAMLQKLTPEAISKSLESTSNRNLREWTAKSLGKTVQAARQAFFRINKKRNTSMKNELLLQ